MIDRLREVVPKNLIEGELAELREHKLRVGLMLFILIGLTAVLLFDDDRKISSNAEEVSLVEEEPIEEAPSDPMSERRAEIIGLARAAEEVQLINPFAVDLPRPEPEPLPPPAPLIVPPPVEPETFEPPTVEPPSVEPTSIPVEPMPPTVFHVMLSLKGTAISGDKKIAVVHREIVSPKDDAPRGVDDIRLIKIGEELDGRTVVDIGKDFVAFDDGIRLELPKVQP